MEFQIPIIALAQLNRAKDEVDEPRLIDLRDSGAIEQDSDIVIMLWKLKQPEPGELVKVGAKVAKCRNGVQGTVITYFDGAHMQFKETAEEYVPVKRKNGRQFTPINSYDPDFPWQ